MKFTAENIAEAFDIDLDDARLAIKIIRYKVSPLDEPRKFPRTHETYSRLGDLGSENDNEMRMSALDELCLTCGVEPIRTSEYIDRFHGEVRASYLNTGDSYATTIIIDHRDLKWRLMSCGDFIDSIEGQETSNGKLIEVL